jgi:hypothetical protein
MYITLFYSQLQSDIVSPSFSHLARTRRTRVSFHSTCAHRRNTHNLLPSPRSFLEPVSHPSRTLTPVTAVVCFVLGTASGVPAHQQVIAIRSADRADNYVIRRGLIEKA